MPGSNPIRRQFLTVCGTALTLMFAVSTRAGDAPRGARQASELSQSLLSIIDTVIENHVDPPPRQTLVLEFCRAIASTQRPPLGLGRAVSDADPEQLRAIIAEHLAAVKTDAADAIALSALQNTLQAHAHTQLTKRSDHRVNEQLAANRYVGIGIAIGMNDQVPMMMKVFEGGPADVSGAKEGEFILEVNGVKTSGRPLTEVIDLLRGPAGTKVEIELAKDKTTTRDVTMIRDVVPLKQVEDFGVIEPGIASVTINSITGSIVRDLRRLTPKIYEHEIHSIVLRVKPHQPDERSSLLLANALIDGKPIGGIEIRRSSSRRCIGSPPGSGRRHDLFRWRDVAAAAERHRILYSGSWCQRS